MYSEPRMTLREYGSDTMTSLTGKNILVVEFQPLVARDIQDRLLDAGARNVSIAGKPGQVINLTGYDALIINATQDRELARSLVSNGAGEQCAFVVLHDDASRGCELFPNAAIVEIPFDSETIRDALNEAFATRQV